MRIPSAQSSHITLTLTKVYTPPVLSREQTAQMTFEQLEGYLNDHEYEPFHIADQAEQTDVSWIEAAQYQDDFTPYPVVGHTDVRKSAP